MSKKPFMGSILLFGLIGMAISIRYCSSKPLVPESTTLGHSAPTPEGNSSGNRHLENATAHKDLIELYQTPIELYGKVVDQNGDPVPDANVSLIPFDNPEGEASRTKVTIASGPNGEFSIKGLKGSGIGVSVTKTGHLTFPASEEGRPASTKVLEYGLLEDKGSRFKDPTKPTVFTLYKLGPMEPLVYFDDQRWRLQVDGTPRFVSLDTKNGTGPHQIEFRFTSNWNQLPNENASNFKRFDWKLEARIPNGGFVSNKSDYTFDAPESGYNETIVIDYPKDHTKWEKTVNRRYFVKFADGTYGRIRFSIDGDSDRSPLLLTSWMNLKPGSRNLASEKKDGTGIFDD